jgi:lysophospholipase L1-like esterase
MRAERAGRSAGRHFASAWLVCGLLVCALPLAARAALPLAARAAGPPAAGAEEPACPPDPGLPALVLPHLASALAQGRTVKIVALGSSSTEGVMASGPEETYPAELQQALRAAWPGRQIIVINRGIGGQDARRELARMGRDVIAHRPQVAIWQVGANAALRRHDPDAFRRLVTEGVQRLQRRGIDVVLMDNQRSPRVLASGDSLVFDRELAEIARATGAALFSRDRLMRGWAREGNPAAEFIAGDKLHHNDLGYRCVAEALARSLLAGLPHPLPEATADR